MKITKEHYDALRNNYKETFHLMSEKDQDEMRNKLNQMRKQLAFEACIKDWKEGRTIACQDFIEVCKALGLEMSESEYKTVSQEIIEIGMNNYSCIGKINKRQENQIFRLTIRVSSKII